MDASAAPWWLAAVMTPLGGSAAGAVAYIWKQREKVQAELRQKAEDREKAEREKVAQKERDERDERNARIAALEAALVAARAELAAVQAARIADHNAHRDKLLELYQGAIDSEGDLREAVRSVTTMPTVVREAIETVTTSLRLAIREELDRTSAVPPAPKRGSAR